MCREDFEEIVVYKNGEVKGKIKAPKENMVFLNNALQYFIECCNFRRGNLNLMKYHSTLPMRIPPVKYVMK